MRRVIQTSVVFITAFILSGCSKIGLFIANTPMVFSDAKVVKNVAYGDEAAQTLDIYIPPNSENSPVLVFLYGGRWTDGHKEQYRFIANAFNNKGYIVVIPDYRKYPNVKFPVFVQDVAASLAWVHEGIKKYGGDADSILLAGHSSGAHLGALVASDPQYLHAHKLERNIIKGFAGLSGPYAFVPEEEDLKDMFGPPERYPLMRAPNFIDGKQPPMLLIQGLEDTIVVLENSQKLKNEINEKGGDVQLVTYKNLNHVETVGSLMWFWQNKSDIKEKMLDFFEARKN